MKDRMWAREIYPRHFYDLSRQAVFDRPRPACAFRRQLLFAEREIVSRVVHTIFASLLRRGADTQ
jgi:hypothetical protein